MSSLRQLLQREAFFGWCGLTAVGVVVLSIRVVVGAHSELRAGDVAAEAGDLAVAAVHYRRAGAWYLPGNPFSSGALARLEEMGNGAKERGDFDLALLAFRSLRGAILASRSFYTPHAGLLGRAERQIAYLMAAQDPPPVDVGKGREQVEREHLALLSKRTRPRLGFALLALVGFGTWVWSIFAIARRAQDAHGRIRLRPLWRVGAALVVGLIAFYLGLRLA